MNRNKNSIYHIEWDNILLQKLINRVMLQGKKAIAEKIVLQSLHDIQNKTNQEPYSIAIKAIEHVKPFVEVKSIRVAGSTYMVPVEISEKRQVALALKWIVENARKRNERQMYQRIAAELLDAANRTGSSIRKKEELHKMAEANRAFAHYRW
jgi:small subunit ribosomal protein S7